MKNIFFVLFIFLFSTTLSAQPAIEWQKTLGGGSFDEAYSVLQTSDGGYIVAGTTASSSGDVFGNHGGSDYWVVKLSSTGAIQWKKALGGNDNEWLRTIQQTSDGGYIIGGYATSNNFDVSGHHGWIDGWVVKLSSTGALEWQRALGGSGWDEIWSVKQTTDGGYIAAGRSSSTDGDATFNNGQLDYWVVKLSDLGAIQWQKSLGGSKEDIAQSVVQTADGGYIVVGETASNEGDVSGLNGNVDFWVVKLSASGDLEWQNALGGANGDIASDVLQSDDGGYVVVGYAGSHNSGDVTGHEGSFDYWVVKLSNSGDLLWQRALGGIEPDWCRGVVKSGDGGYVLVGTTTSTDGEVVGNDGGGDVWVVKLTDMGEIVWQKTYGGTQGDTGFAISPTSDGSYIFAGYAWSNNGDVSGGIQGYNDFWVVKLAPESVGTINLPAANANRFDIYPNPAQSAVFLKIATEESPLNVAVSDLLGRELLRQTILNGEQLDISLLANGLYLLTARAPSGQTFSKMVRKGE